MEERAIIFDMDGLLVDTEPTWRKVMIESFEQFGVVLTEDDCRKTMGFRLNQVIDYWYDHRNFKNGSKAALEKLILDRMEAAILSTSEMMPGAKSAIELALSITPKTAIASSSPYQLIHAFVAKHQLSSAFQLLYSAEHELYGKPHPGVFLTAAEKLGVKHHQCVVLEDSLNGVIAARAAAMKCIAVPATNDNGKPEFAIAHVLLDSLNDLLPEHLTA